MKRLYLLFDRECGLCRACCQWLRLQPAFIELEFIPLQTPDLGRRFAGIEQFDLRERLVAISDEGDVYEGQHAWIMCLYALREYRAWSLRLAHPALMPFAARVCDLVSKNRLTLSHLFLSAPTEELTQQLEALPPAICRTGYERCR